jgi:hypothetical protein
MDSQLTANEFPSKFNATDSSRKNSKILKIIYLHVFWDQDAKGEKSRNTVSLNHYLKEKYFFCIFDRNNYNSPGVFFN